MKELYRIALIISVLVLPLALLASGEHEHEMITGGVPRLFSSS